MSFESSCELVTIDFEFKLGNLTLLTYI